MLQQIIKRITRAEQAFILISLISIILVIWQHLGMTKTLTLHTFENNPAATWNDNINGGTSKGMLSIIDNTFVLDCDLKKSPHTFAFCGFIKPFVDGKRGVDLSTFDTMDIDVAVESNYDDTVIIYLLNLDKDADSMDIRRANTATIFPTNKMQTYSLKLSSFSLPSWWLFKFPTNKAGIQHTDISNVTDIQISSGDNTVERQEIIKVKNITFRGKWIAKDTLYLGVLVVWLLSFLVYVTYRFITLNRRLHKSKSKTRELTKLNAFLSIEKDKFESMAKVDPLTQTFNRAGIRTILDKALSDLQENGSPCSFIMLDIDYFKQINDTFGHDVGDAVLVALTDYIKANTRANDHLLRWGGEEFILVCTDTRLEIAGFIAEKLRRGICKQVFAGQKISCSFGVGPLRYGDIELSFKAVDKALYKAKENGRDRIVTAK